MTRNEALAELKRINGWLNDMPELDEWIEERILDAVGERMVEITGSHDFSPEELDEAQ